VSLPFLDLIDIKKAYELSLDVKFCNSKHGKQPESLGSQLLIAGQLLMNLIRLTDGLFTIKNVDRCVNLLYDVMWSCFEVCANDLSTFCQEISVGHEELNGSKKR
jgi:hypothetical protein